MIRNIDEGRRNVTPEASEKLQMSKLLEDGVVLEEILEVLSDLNQEEPVFVNV